MAEVLSDLSIPVHMIYAHALVDLYVARRVLRETINPSDSHQLQQRIDAYLQACLCSSGVNLRNVAVAKELKACVIGTVVHGDSCVISS